MRILCNSSLLHDQDSDIVCFDGLRHKPGEKYDVSRYLDFDAIVKSLPPGWKPELVAVTAPMYLPIPLGIENAPCPAVLLLDDWFGAVEYITDTFRVFDHIFTDKNSIGLLRQLGFENVDYFPCFGHDPEIFKLRNGFPDRLYDVTFAGNFNGNVQPERLPWLKRLCLLDSRYNVKLFNSLWGEEYVEMLNHSKIVFNRSIKGEMNMRAFEAAACGALLFMEEENLEIRDFLEPGKECVLYRDDNMEELIGYYLSHEQERVTIATAGHQKIDQYSYPKLFARLISRTRELNGRPRINRNRAAAPYSTNPLHRNLVQLALTGISMETTIDLIARMLQDDPQDALLFNDASVILASYIENARNCTSSEILSIRKQISSLLDISTRKGSLTARFNAAQVNLQWGNYDEAELRFEQTLEQKMPESYESCKGLVYPVHFRSPIRVAWSNAVRDGIPDTHKIMCNRYDLIRCHSMIGLARVCEQRTNRELARAWYQRSLEILPLNFTSVTALAQSAGQEIASAEVLSSALKLDPFDPVIWKKQAQWLLQNDQPAAAAFIRECLLCMSRVQFSDQSAIVELNDLLTRVHSEAQYHSGDPEPVTTLH